ncbi:MAG TPA: hypothetical protein VJJ23_00045 [Candidatus Nanoarchaeia archaeon]|nr:hypothetical protein [Candidatus Nanoarchaeia archaeon]
MAAEQNPLTNPGEIPQDIAKVIKIKPGSSSEKSLKVLLSDLPEHMKNATIEQILKYATTGELSRGNERYAERIRNEMQGAYGMTVNGNPVTGKENLGTYFVRKEAEGIPYDEVELIIAAKQEGGLEGYLR